MAAGRTDEARSVASVVTTNASAAITFPADAIVEEDAGRAITGTGIPANATIATVSSTTAGTLSAVATASGTVTVALAGKGDYGFAGWSPETDPESESYSVAARNAGATGPTNLTNNYTQQIVQRGRT